jgi:hypothetical protein
MPANLMDLLNWIQGAMSGIPTEQQSRDLHQIWPDPNETSLSDRVRPSGPAPSPASPLVDLIHGGVNYVQGARQMADQNMVGRNLTPSLPNALAMSGMNANAPSPVGLKGLYNATAPPMGKSMAETGLRFPESTVQRHVQTAPELPNQGVQPTAAVKAADGMSGDAAEALINQLMGIGAK